MTTLRLFDTGTILDWIHDGSIVPTEIPYGVHLLAKIQEGGALYYKYNPEQKNEIELFRKHGRDLSYAHGTKVALEEVLGQLLLSTRDPRYSALLHKIREL